jgi:hypothetical protein
MALVSSNSEHFHFLIIFKPCQASRSNFGSIEVSSPRRVILRSVSFLLYFTLNLIYVSQPFMHEIVSPIIPIIMSHRLTEHVIQICGCLNILLHVIALTKVMPIFAYLAPG